MQRWWKDKRKSTYCVSTRHDRQRSKWEHDSFMEDNVSLNSVVTMVANLQKNNILLLMHCFRLTVTQHIGRHKAAEQLRINLSKRKDATFCVTRRENWRFDICNWTYVFVIQKASLNVSTSITVFRGQECAQKFTTLHTSEVDWRG